MLATSADGTPIYFEVDGEAPPLLLCHGSFGSLIDWHDFGYVAALRDTRRLILVDARGHGRSGKPHDPARYALACRVADVVAVLDVLDIAAIDFMGYSMGGWIGFGLALHAPTRCRSLILGGAHPFADDMQGFRSLVPDDPADFLERLAPVYGEYLGPALRNRMQANDFAALRALAGDREDISFILPTMVMPCLLFAGTTDPRWPKVVDCARRMPNARFFSVPDCGHVAAWGRSDLTLPHINQFLGGP